MQNAGGILRQPVQKLVATMIYVVDINAPTPLGSTIKKKIIRKDGLLFYNEEIRGESKFKCRLSVAIG